MSGFDAFVGNPPFAGKNTLTAGSREGYIDWLQAIHPESHGNSDLVAHFFRRAFALIRDGGTLGLIATNTIAQGDTRTSGLRWICTHGGMIYQARRRMTWPGLASVVVSLVCVSKGSVTVPALLDEARVDRITAFLVRAGGDDDPLPLAMNAGKSFMGSVVLGVGFLFEDGGEERGASTIVEMKKLVAQDARNSDAIFPYLGGEEFNNSPDQSHSRYIVDFGELREAEVAERWPALLEIVRTKVRPARLKSSVTQRDRRELWWLHATRTPEVRQYLRDHTRCLAVCGVAPHLAFSFVPANTVFAHSLLLFLFDCGAGFAVLQARSHEAWARFFGSSMKDDLRYTPSDCFETFPFPPDFLTNPTLEHIGQAYYGFRADLMARNNEGLTKTYNRFHDPDERSAVIFKLRELHAEMDRAVLDAYRWTDLHPVYDFRPQLDESVRYTWAEEMRDEVLARLLELNRLIAEREAAANAKQAGESKGKGGGARKGGRKGMGSAGGEVDEHASLLPGLDQEQKR